MLAVFRWILISPSLRSCCVTIGISWIKWCAMIVWAPVNRHRILGTLERHDNAKVHAISFGVTCLRPKVGRGWSLPKPQNTSRNERWYITSLISIHSDLTRTADATTWKTCTVTATITMWVLHCHQHVLQRPSWCEDHDDSWYVHVSDAEWRSVQSRNFHMSLLWRSATLYEYYLVQLQHAEVEWWLDQYEGNERTVWIKCRTTLITTLFFALWLVINNVLQLLLRTDTRPGECLIVSSFQLFLVFSVFELSYTLLGLCTLIEIRSSQAMHHLKTLWTLCSSHLACGRADSIPTCLLFMRSRHSSHILILKVQELVRAHFPLGSGTVDSCLCQEDQNTLRWKHWSYGVEVLGRFTDGEHEIKKLKHMWTDDDLEDVQKCLTLCSWWVLRKVNVQSKQKMMHGEREDKTKTCLSCGMSVIDGKGHQVTWKWNLTEVTGHDETGWQLNKNCLSSSHFVMMYEPCEMKCKWLHVHEEREWSLTISLILLFCTPWWGVEPMQMMDTETRTVNAMMLLIFEQMSQRSVYSRRWQICVSSKKHNTIQFYGNRWEET